MAVDENPKHSPPAPNPPAPAADGAALGVERVEHLQRLGVAGAHRAALGDAGGPADVGLRRAVERRRSWPSGRCRSSRCWGTPARRRRPTPLPVAAGRDQARRDRRGSPPAGRRSGRTPCAPAWAGLAPHAPRGLGRGATATPCAAVSAAAATGGGPRDVPRERGRGGPRREDGERGAAQGEETPVHRRRRLPRGPPSREDLPEVGPSRSSPVWIAPRGLSRETGDGCSVVAVRARAALLIAVLLATVAAGGASAAPFAPRTSLNVRGDVTVAANTVLTCPAADPACGPAQAGGGGQNNDFAMTRVDADGDPSTFDSSRATLDLPAGAIVRFAGLYWGARIDGGAGGGPAPDPSAVAPRPPGHAGHGAATSRWPAGRPARAPSPAAPGYQAFADVTALVSAGGAGAIRGRRRPGRHGRGARGAAGRSWWPTRTRPCRCATSRSRTATSP